MKDREFNWQGLLGWVLLTGATLLYLVGVGYITRNWLVSQTFQADSFWMYALKGWLVSLLITLGFSVLLTTIMIPIQLFHLLFHKKESSVNTDDMNA